MKDDDHDADGSGSNGAVMTMVVMTVTIVIMMMMNIPVRPKSMVHLIFPGNEECETQRDKYELSFGHDRKKKISCRRS